MQIGVKSLYRSKTRVTIVAVVALCFVLTVSLRGAVPQKTILVVNGDNYLNAISGEIQENVTGYSDNLRNWTVFHTPGANASIKTSQSGFLINGTFSASTTLQRISVSKELSLNVSQYPTMTLEFNSTLNLPIGIGVFAVETNGSRIQVGNLNQLVGNGTNITLRTNLLFGQESITSNATIIEFYVNEGPSSSPTQFFLQIKSLQFSSHLISSNSNDYRSVFLQFSNSMPSGNSSWPFDHANLGATIRASYDSTFEVYMINGTTVYNEGSYKFSPTVAKYEYTLLPRDALNEQQLEALSASLPATNGVAIAFVATSGTIYNMTVQYSQFIFLPAPSPSSSLYLEKSQYSYLYAYLMTFLFIIPVIGSLFIYQRYRHGKLTKKSILLAVIVGAIVRLALAPVTSHPYDTLVYITSARAWFQYGITNVSLGPTLPFTFFLYRIPYSLYALIQFSGFHDLHFMGHTQGMLETVFIKAFPMISDFVVFCFLTKMTKDNIGTVFGALYLLNPLSIYVSAVWAQYEAATSAFILMGFWLLTIERPKFKGILDSNFFASVAITASALLELFALIPLGFLIIRSFFAKPYRWLTTLLLAVPLLLFLLYQPELHLSYLVLLSASGVVSALGFGTPSIYSLTALFPLLANYHLLLVSLFLVTLWFILLDKKDLGNTALFALGGFLCLILFGNQLVQWWELVPPLAFAAAILTKKHTIGFFMPAFGTIVAFVGLSFTQGSGYMTLGSSNLFLAPALEQTNDNLLIFTVITTVAAAILAYYMIRKPGSGTNALRNSSILLLAASLVVYVAVRSFGL